MLNSKNVKIAALAAITGGAIAFADAKPASAIMWPQVRNKTLGQVSIQPFNKKINRGFNSGMGGAAGTVGNSDEMCRIQYPGNYNVYGENAGNGWINCYTWKWAWLWW